MHEILINRYFATAVAVAAVLSMFAAASAHAEENECQATVKYLGHKAADKNTKVNFEVKTNCEASAGSFEYSFKNNGKVEVRNAPSWAASEGKNFQWTDEFPVPALVVTDVKVGKVKSVEVK